MTITSSEPRSGAGTSPRAAVASRSSTDRMQFPFNIVEEIWQLRDPSDETANIHLEVRVSGALDEDNLRQAIRIAVDTHPMARARRVSRRVLLRSARWQIEEPELGDILEPIHCRDESKLAAARVDFYNQSISLLKAPALRFLLAHQPDGDSLMLNAHHAITDGVGALRFLRSVARAYCGRQDPVPAVDPLVMRDPKFFLGSAAGRRFPEAESPCTPTGARAFLAPEGARPGSGYGFLHVTLPAEQSRRLDPRRFEPSATINDLLQAALHLAIAEWNARRHHRCDCIAVFMPANSRPPEWRDELVINHTVGGKVTSTPQARATAESLMAVVTKQTRWIKSGGAAAMVFDHPSWVLNLTPLLLPMISLLLGDRVENTAVLSNLGRLGDVPEFGSKAGAVTGFGFSAPCGMPMGLSVGVAGVHGRLHLVFRYRRALFDAGAARRFADLFLECLLRLGQDETLSGPGMIAEQ
jgi:NRPS condensation-like uncharacterized protein